MHLPCLRRLTVVILIVFFPEMFTSKGNDIINPITFCFRVVKSSLDCVITLEIAGLILVNVVSINHLCYTNVSRVTVEFISPLN